MDSRGIGDAQASAESAWIGDAVEREQEVRFVERIEESVNLCHLTSNVDTGQHSRRGARHHSVKSLALAGDDENASL
jgi:hypothetical protein